MKLRKWSIILAILFTTFCLFFCIFFHQTTKAEPKPPEKSELPKLSLALNGFTFEDFANGNKNTKYPGNLATFVVDDNSFKYENVEIKGRGNSTWWNSAKKPFQIKLASKENLFSLKKAKKWVLLANDFDDSHLRNDTALFLANLLEEEYATGGEFIELSVNEDYKGLYYLTHKVEIATGSVNLKDPLGILMELDNIHAPLEQQEVCDYFSQGGNCLIFKDAVAEDDTELVSLASTNFLNSFNQFEIAAKNRDWENLNAIVDVKSLAEYFLVSEFTLNPDAYSTSYYFYKNGDDDKIHIGPVWDFDFAFGNYRWYQFSPTDITPRKVQSADGFSFNYDSSTMIYEALDIPEVQTAIKNLFQEKLSGKKDLVLTRIDQMTEKIRDAAILNNEMWERDDFDNSVQYLRDWVATRFDFFETIYK